MLREHQAADYAPLARLPRSRVLHVCALGCDAGIVPKKRGCYIAGRTDTWRKVKNSPAPPVLRGAFEDWDKRIGDTEGKLDVLRIECTRCQRKDRYSVAGLIAKYGRRGRQVHSAIITPRSRGQIGALRNRPPIRMRA